MGMESEGLPAIAVRAQAEADQMWEELRTRSSQVIELKNRLKKGAASFEESELALMDYIVCAALFEVRLRNLRRKQL